MSAKVAKMIREARTSAALTQAELARRVGVTQQQIAKFESRQSNPTLNTLTAIAQALGLTLDVRITSARYIRALQAATAREWKKRYGELLSDSARLRKKLEAMERRTKR